MIGIGNVDSVLNEDDVRELVNKASREGNFKGKKILAIFPDDTRSGPVPLFFRSFADIAAKEAESFDVLIALGTHGAMNDAALEKHLGYTKEEKETKYSSINIINHQWDVPSANVVIGTISAKETSEISNGLMEEAVDVSINKLIFDYDLLLVCGPVFPHEVVGFSGGNKYFFPGIAAGEIINYFHWMGALATNPKIIGNKNTMVRKVVDKCASMITQNKMALTYVVNSGDLKGAFFDTPENAWKSAADLSNQLHIHYSPKAYHTVLSCAPKMYDDIWTAGKCMYKMEPVVEDGGTLIIYAPHVSEISYTHGEVMDKIGYHCRDYFLKQMDKFEGIPRGVMAHSTHVRGIGEFIDGVEKCRIKVVLATAISKERCEALNMGYMDPATINVEDYADKEDEGILYIKKAGETLYKLKDGPEWQNV